MNHAEFQLRGISDPRLAVHATSVHPAWLWSIDGKRILWANPVGAALFKADNAAALAEKIFGPADAQRRQVARLAGTLPPSGAMRLERLRGFGAALGTLVTCGCARLDFADGGHGILIAGVEANGRTMPLAERLRRLVARIDAPVAALTRDGAFVGASEAARSLLDFGSLSEVGLDDARIEALRQGRFETPVGTGHLVLQRVGSGADIGLVVLIPPGATPATAATEPPAFDDERPATSAQAPAEFALIDEFLEPPAQAAVEPTASDQPPEPDIGHADTIAEPSPAPPQHPLRFTWRIDAEGRFSLDPGEFTRLIGASERRTSDIDLPALDPHGRLATAIATHDTWSGITVNWPVDGGGHLPVELSGLPLRDRAENFAGYRGFGVCRDLEGLARLAASPRTEFPGNSPTPSTVIVQPNSADIVEKGPGDSPAADPPAKPDVASSDTPLSPAPDSFETSQQTDLETAVETPEESPEEAPTEESREAARNVLPFRPISEPKCPALTSVENSAFNELARQLSVRLDSENGAAVAAPATPEATPAVHEPGIHELALPEPPSERPDWLEPAETPARGEARRDRALLDLLPVGVLIYRLDRLVYANRAFLSQLGYDGLHALEDAGGLDALYVEPGISSASSTSDAGKPVRISGTEVSSQHPPVAIDARLFTISWDGDPALALIFSDTPTPAAAVAAALPQAPPVVEAPAAAAPSTLGHANAEELGAILDTTAEGILMFDADGNIHSCNRSAEALFGYDGPELVRRNLIELFAPESQPAVLEYLSGIKGAQAASLLDHGRDVLGRVRKGGIIPLSITMGRTRPDRPNFFAVFRELPQGRKSRTKTKQAARPADRTADAKADLLARISHEVRIPLNAIIGFAEVMIGERFGALGNERYLEYIKDIRSSGERVIAIVNDLLDLSRIETGRLDLTFANQNLNDLVEQCVAVMQPQANRERIIIRTSLATALPPVIADARALRQIALNLIGNSIHLANAGGQVIVSTALSDFDEVVLRVRDTGQGLNDSELAAAMEPFRTHAPSDQAPESAGVNLSLTKALIEANRAHFHIKTATHSGTLIEVTFSHAVARAQAQS